jgi:antirestriction protein ArdC
MPKNASTGRFYFGIDVLILWGSGIERGFPVQRWLTFRQALGFGGNVRKGEHSTTVVYADRFIPDDEKNGRESRARKRKRSRSSSASLSSTWRNAKACRRISWSPHCRRSLG